MLNSVYESVALDVEQDVLGQDLLTDEGVERKQPLSKELVLLSVQDVALYFGRQC